MFKFNLRFMGQYWDEEKASSYNYYRDYAPGIGRYLQSDPIGLDGGINTYGYAGANSLSYNDPFGLDIWIEGASGKEPYINDFYMHLSLSIGNPLGDYISFSFGANYSFCPLGCVYNDVTKGGKIIKYMKTTEQQDKFALAYLESQRKHDNYKIYGINTTCVGYTEDKFEKIKKLLNIIESNPPYRKTSPVEKNSNPYVSTGIGLGLTTTTSIIGF